MPEFIHITAAYSNAVLLAVLPYVSDFAKKVDLPIPNPIDVNEVISSRPLPFKNYISDNITLTNEYFFFFHWHGPEKYGYVQSFRAPTNFFTEQEIPDPQKYKGVDHITTNEVVKISRKTLYALGYQDLATEIEKPPIIKGPYDSNQKVHIPYCRLTWTWPKTDDLTLQNWIILDYNLDTKAFVGMQLLFSKNTPISVLPVNIDVVPELESEYQKRIKANGKMFINTNAPLFLPK